MLKLKEVIDNLLVLDVSKPIFVKEDNLGIPRWAFHSEFGKSYTKTEWRNYILSKVELINMIG